MQLCQIHFYQKVARKKVARVNAAYESFFHLFESFFIKINRFFPMATCVRL